MIIDYTNTCHQRTFSCNWLLSRYHQPPSSFLIYDSRCNKVTSSTDYTVWSKSNCHIYNKLNQRQCDISMDGCYFKSIGPWSSTSSLVLSARRRAALDCNASISACNLAYDKKKEFHTFNHGTEREKIMYRLLFYFSFRKNGIGTFLRLSCFIIS